MTSAERAAGRVTSADVARSLGVSQSTVSLALSGSPKISEAMRQRVVERCAAMGYRPIASARSLRTGRSDTIGLLIPQMGFEAFERILSGVRGELARSAPGGRYAVLVGVTDNDEDEQRALARAAEAQDFDALLLCAVAAPDATLLSRFPGRVVVLDDRIAGVPSVSMDTASAYREIVQRLTALGHPRLAHLTAHRKAQVEAKHDALRAAAAAARGPLEVSRIEAGAWTVAAAAEAVAPVLDAPAGVRPTAILADDVVLASAVYGAAADRGIRIPADLTVLCGDLGDAGLGLRPRLAGIRLPEERLGATGARVALAALGHGDTPDLEPLRCEVVWSDSVGPAPAA